jgi:inner membrane protein
MSPLTHLLASWIVAAKTTDNPRDRTLVTLAGVAPDVDGLGLFVDMATGRFATEKLYYYPEYHHWLTHGLPAALAFSIMFAAFARRRWRVFFLSLLTFHLHLLCDLLGSRGPDKSDVWPIFYFGPISTHPVWFWKYQWRLDGWQNIVITIALFFWSLALAVKMGDSFVGVFNRRADEVFVRVLQKWRSQLSGIATAQTLDRTAPGSSSSKDQ